MLLKQSSLGCLARASSLAVLPTPCHIDFLAEYIAHRVRYAAPMPEELRYDRRKLCQRMSTHRPVTPVPG